VPRATTGSSTHWPTPSPSRCPRAGPRCWIAWAWRGVARRLPPPPPVPRRRRAVLGCGRLARPAPRPQKQALPFSSSCCCCWCPTVPVLLVHSSSGSDTLLPGGRLADRLAWCWLGRRALQPSPITPDARTYTMLVNAHAKAGDYDGARRMVTHLLDGHAVST
jgi:pentatricopeptide repeat protein